MTTESEVSALRTDVRVWATDHRKQAQEAERLRKALDAVDLAAGYYRRELKEILAHCEDDDRERAIGKIREHAQTAIRAADAALASLT